MKPVAQYDVFVLKYVRGKKNSSKEPNADDLEPKNCKRMKVSTRMRDTPHMTNGRRWVYVKSRPSDVVVAVDVAAAPARVNSNGLQLIRKLNTAVVNKLHEGCSTLTLPDEPGKERVCWAGVSSAVLFVRPAFEGLYSKILTEYKRVMAWKGTTDLPKKWLLLGVPGIGKSSFGQYLLWRLVTEEKLRVYYHYEKGNMAGVECGPDGAGISFIIVDGSDPTKLPFLPDVPTILISSPRGHTTGQPIYSEFKKGALFLYMPMPTEDEVLEMWKACFNGPLGAAGSEDAVLERIERWGTVPRYALFNVGAEKGELETSIRAADRSALIDVLKLGSLEDAAMKLSFRLVHYVVGRKYSTVRYKWASPYVERRLYTMLRRGEAASRLLYMEACLNSTRSGELSGLLFEAYAGERMTLGGVFRVKRLGPPICVNDARDARAGAPRPAAVAATAAAITAAADAAARFKAFEKNIGLHFRTGETTGLLHLSPSDVTRELLATRVPTLDGAGLLPVRTQFAPGTAAADFVEICGVPSNATLSTRHDIVVLGRKDTNGLLALRTHLYSAGAPLPEVQPVFWLVPPKTYAEMKVGMLVVSRAGRRSVSSVLARSMLEARARALKVVQYAVEMQAPTGDEMKMGKLAPSVVPATPPPH